MENKTVEELTKRLIEIRQEEQTIMIELLKRSQKRKTLNCKKRKNIL